MIILMARWPEDKVLACVDGKYYAAAGLVRN